MISAIIADDEPGSTRLLKDALEATAKIRVVGQAANGTECLQLLEEQEPDALFLDIQMGELSGLEVAEIALESDKPPMIAFITAFDAYAVKAFELAAVDYVVKSVGVEEFGERIAATVERMEESQRQHEAPPIDAVREVFSQLTQKQLQFPSRKLPVKDYEEGTVRLIDPATVICVERKDRRVVLRTQDKEFPTYFTIERLAQRLADEHFFRANPGALINMAYVSHLIPNGDGSYDALLNDEAGETVSVITVSRSRAKALFDQLGM